MAYKTKAFDGLWTLSLSDKTSLAVPVNILVLDEDSIFAGQLAGEMMRLGHEAVAFQAWPSALYFLDGPQPADLILTGLEFQATGPNGVSFARLALRRRPGILVLFVAESVEVARKVDPRLGPVVLKSQGVSGIVDVILAMAARRAGIGGRRENDTSHGQGEPTHL